MQRLKLIIATCMLAHASISAASNDVCRNGYTEMRLSAKVYDEEILNFLGASGADQFYAGLTYTYKLPKTIIEYSCVPDVATIRYNGEILINNFNDGDYISAIVDFYKLVSLYHADDRFDERFIVLEHQFFGLILAACLNIDKEKERDYSIEMISNRLLLFDELAGNSNAFYEYRDAIATLPQSSFEARNHVTAITLRVFLAIYAEKIKHRFGKKLDKYDETFSGAIEESIAWYSDTMKKTGAH